MQKKAYQTPHVVDLGHLRDFVQSGVPKTKPFDDGEGDGELLHKNKPDPPGFSSNDFSGSSSRSGGSERGGRRD